MKIKATLAIYFVGYRMGQRVETVERYRIDRTDAAYNRAMAKAVAKHGTLASFANWEK